MEWTRRVHFSLLREKNLGRQEATQGGCVQKVTDERFAVNGRRARKIDRQSLERRDLIRKLLNIMN
jgi:hypothetical protein